MVSYFIKYFVMINFTSILRRLKIKKNSQFNYEETARKNR